MIALKCADCGLALEWKGRGRKPKRCGPCKKKADRANHSKVVHRIQRHEKGRSASRWGDLWLTDGRPIRREARYVWGATGDSDDSATNRSGVFHYIGKDGLPDEGTSLSMASDYSDLRWRITENYRLARESDEAIAWLQANKNWWRFETFAHESFTRDITDSVTVHAGTHTDDPDETTNVDRCSFCGDANELILAGEFCSEECMADYVRTFGADGLDLGGSNARDAGGMAEGSYRADEAMVCGAAA